MNQTLSEFLRQFLTEDRLQRFDEVIAERTQYLTVVLENVYHAHNASACLRTCDCFGIQDVHIIESANSFEPNKEIALGASQWLTLHSYRSSADSTSGDDAIDPEPTRACIRQLQERGYRVYATSPRQDSRPIHELTTDQPMAFVFGAEQLGVSDTAIAHADGLVHIPMFGFTESFNVSVSVAVLLHHFSTAVRAAGVAWELSDEVKQGVLDVWVRQSLGDKLAPLERRFAAEQPAS